MTATSALDTTSRPDQPDPLDRAGWISALTDAREQARETPSLVNRVKAIVAWARSTPPARTMAHFSARRGPQFSASNAYFALFSVFAMLAIAFSIFGFVLRGNPGLQRGVRDVISEALPGVLESGVVPQGDYLQLPSGGGLTIAVVVSTVALLFTAVGWINALAQGLRAMAARPAAGGNPVVAKLLQFAVMVILGIAVLVSAIFSAFSGQAQALLSDVGIDTESTFVSLLLSVVGFVLALLIDAVVVVAMFRLAGRLRFGFAIEREAALLTALGLGILKTLGSLLLRGASANPLLASAAVLVGLLIWFNLIGRVMMLGAAWATVRWADADAATNAEAMAIAGPAVGGWTAAGTTAAVTAAETTIAGSAPASSSSPAYSERAGERTSVLAGAVLGAAAVLGVRLMGSAVKNTWRLIRGHR